jgi:hypothetical protein
MICNKRESKTKQLLRVENNEKQETHDFSAMGGGRGPQQCELVTFSWKKGKRW